MDADDVLDGLRLAAMRSLWSSPRRERVFVDPKDDSSSNAEAWREGIKAARAGDVPGALAALERAQGSVKPLNAKGAPARNACAKAVAALRSDLKAWARLAESKRRTWDQTPEAGDSDALKAWMPHSVDMLDYLWAANPEALARAAKLWRESCEASKRWWTCPFLKHRYDGPAGLPHALLGAVERHFGADRPEGRSFSSTPAGAEAGGLARSELLDAESLAERSALGALLAEVSRGALSQLWDHEESAIKTRSLGGTVWSRGGNEWGLTWFGAAMTVDQGPSGERSALGKGVDEALAEALAISSEQGFQTARMICLSSANYGFSELGARVLSLWLDACPDDPRGLPLEARDWVDISNLASMVPLTDKGSAALGRWLAGPGQSWPAPGKIGPRGLLACAEPAWSFKSTREDALSSLPGLDQWTPLEWMVFQRPAAARAACSLGAKLAEGFEAALMSAERWVPNIDKEQALAWAQACALASASSESPAPRSARKAAL